MCADLEAEKMKAGRCGGAVRSVLNRRRLGKYDCPAVVLMINGTVRLPRPQPQQSPNHDDIRSAAE